MSSFLAINFMRSVIWPEKQINFPKLLMREREIQIALQVSKSRRNFVSSTFFQIISDRWTEASNPLPLRRADRPTDWWMDWVEMRARLCCQDAQSSPGTFQSSNKPQLTWFLVFGKNAKNAKKQKKDLKNHSFKTIDHTEFCLASSERGELDLS